MPVGFEKIDYNNLELSIKRSQDVHSSFQLENLLADGIDAHFMARSRRVNMSQSLDLASNFWKVTDYNTFAGYFVLPKNYNLVAIYSRRAFMNPQMYVRTILPDIRLVGNESYFDLYMGIENGAGAGNGIASFMLETAIGVTNRLSAVVGPLNGSVSLIIDIAKPTDFNTAIHYYRIMHSNNITFFIIDNRIRAIAVQCYEGSAIKVKENVLPYSIVLIPQMSPTLKAMIEWNAGGRIKTATEDMKATLSPAWFRVSDGKSIIPLQLPLYLDNNDTKLAGYSISSGSVTSHPFPLWGYTYKTLLFMANQSGTLEIDVYTASGNWRAYDTVSVSVNTLVKYRFQDTFPLARVVFTPGTYPATISEAEIDLS